MNEYDKTFLSAQVTSLTVFSTAEMSDDCVSKFTSLVHSRDLFSPIRTLCEIM